MVVAEQDLRCIEQHRKHHASLPTTTGVASSFSESIPVCICFWIDLRILFSGTTSHQSLSLSLWLLADVSKLVVKVTHRFVSVVV